MFFDSSTRSTRPITCRSCTTSSSAASAASHSGDAAAARMSAGSDASGETNAGGSSSASARDEAAEVVGPALAVEAAGAVGGQARRAARGPRPRAGRRSHTGGANGRVVEVHARQVGPRRRAGARPTRHRW